MKLEPNDRPETKKHGTPVSARNEDERFRIRQDIELVPGGMLAKILKTNRICVNSLHSQIIDQLAPGLVVEATAEDGSVEAASVGGAKNFALGVIFHPEYWAERDAPSLAILQAFGEAVRRDLARWSVPMPDFQFGIEVRRRVWQRREREAGHDLERPFPPVRLRR